jgi:hypothetical protein
MKTGFAANWPGSFGGNLAGFCAKCGRGWCVHWNGLAEMSILVYLSQIEIGLLGRWLRGGELL